MPDTRKRYIVRYSKMQFALRYDEDEAHAVFNTVWNLDMENESKVLLQCYEYTPEVDSGEPEWEGPLFSHDHTYFRPFKPNWVVRYGQAEEVK